MKKKRPVLTLPAVLILLLSCAAAPSSLPDWALSPAAITAVYPDGAYIARIGRGQSREIAETAAAAEIARFFSSQISANRGYRETTSQVNGVTLESLETETSAYVSSEITLFGIRYAQDAFYNRVQKQWETVAYINRDEAWAVYEPRFKRQADAFYALYRAAETEAEPFKKALRWKAAEQYAGSTDFEAANTLGQMLHPARMNAAFSAVRNEIAALPQKLDEARRNAAVYIDCPVDFESIIANAFSRALSAEGFPVSKTRNAASAVCSVTITEGMQKRELGIFYFPSVQAVIMGSAGGEPSLRLAEGSGALFTYTASADSVGAVTADVAKRRAYRALEERIQETFSTEFRTGSEK